MKPCIKCNIEKDESGFYKGMKSICKECHKLYKKKDLEKTKTTDRRYYWKKKYGLTEDQYRKMSKDQNGLCKACNNPPTGRNTFLSVDHCHSTGRIRGLLCSNCNLAVGNLLESFDRALMVANYIKETAGTPINPIA